MNRKALKRILEEIVTGKELIPLFVESGIAPSVLYWALKEFLQHPDRTLAKKVTSRKRVTPQYLLDRIGNLVDQVDEFRASNPYSTLQVTYQADLSFIREQWKSLLKEWHPDRLKDEAESLTKAQEINEAYRLLKSPEDRKSYDQQFAPLLAIVKDIEEQPRPSFDWGRPGHALIRRYGVIGGIVFASGLLLWGVYSQRSRVPVPSSKKAKTVSHMSVPATSVTEKAARHAPVPSVPEVKVAAVRPREAASMQRRPVPSKEKKVKKTPASPLPQRPPFTVLAGLSGGGGAPIYKVSSEITGGIAEGSGVFGQVLGEAGATCGVATGTFGSKVSSEVVHKGAGTPWIGGQALGEVGSSYCGAVCFKVAGGPHPKVAARIKAPPVPLQANPEGKASPSQGISMPEKTKPVKPVQTETKRQPNGSPREVVRRYVTYYQAGNYSGLFTLFDGRARENGVPIRDVLEDYRIFLRHMKIVRFDLKDTAAHRRRDQVIYSGRYTIEYVKLASEGRITREGTLTIILVREKNRWLIQKLNYLSR